MFTIQQNSSLILYTTILVAAVQQAVHGDGAALGVRQSPLPRAWRPLHHTRSGRGRYIPYDIDNNHPCPQDCLSYTELVFRLLGCLNLARGFFIFLIFVCKESTLTKVSLSTD